MAVGYPPPEEPLATAVWELPAYESFPEADGQLPIRIDALAIALLILAVFLAIQLFSDRSRGEIGINSAVL